MTLRVLARLLRPFTHEPALAGAAVAVPPAARVQQHHTNHGQGQHRHPRDVQWDTSVGQPAPGPQTAQVDDAAAAHPLPGEHIRRHYAAPIDEPTAAHVMPPLAPPDPLSQLPVPRDEVPPYTFARYLAERGGHAPEGVPVGEQTSAVAADILARVRGDQRPDPVVEQPGDGAA